MIGVNLLQRVPRARYPRSAVGRRRSCGVCLGLQPPTASAKQGDFGLEDRAEELPERPLPAAAKVAERIRKRRRRLFTFLDDPSLEAANNRAERALRPAVIARKSSCGNKTLRGKRTWEILTSLAATCYQPSQDSVEYLRPFLALAPAPSAR